MKILVTGAGVFVGGAVARLAAASGHEVFAGSRRQVLLVAGTTNVGLDVHDEDRPSRWPTRHGLLRFVGLGSQAEYGPLEGRTAETRLPEPTSRYGATKLATLHLARHMCEALGVTFAWARLFSTYGPGDRPTWLIPSIISELRAGRAPRTSSGEQLWDYLYIDDTARALLRLCECSGAQPRGRTAVLRGRFQGFQLHCTVLSLE